MKVVWGKFGTGVDLIVCAISSYWWVSLWVNEKDAFHAYSLKTSIIVFLGIMFFLSIAAYGTVTFLLKRIYIYEWGMQISFLKYKKKIEWEEFSVIRRYHNHFFFNMSKQKDAGPYWAMFHPFTSFVIFDNSRNRSVHIIPLSADEFCELLTSYGVKYTESK